MIRQMHGQARAKLSAFSVILSEAKHLSAPRSRTTRNSQSCFASLNMTGVKTPPAIALWLILNRRFNNPNGLRGLAWIFLVTAIVFSVLPLLRYFRGHSMFDYELWYTTGKHVLAG